MNTFFDHLGRRFAQAAARRGVTMDAPVLGPAEAEELLDLARVAAHTQERRFAPLATYLAGMTAERIRAAGGDGAPGEVAALIREVRQDLEREAGTESGRTPARDFPD